MTEALIIAPGSIDGTTPQLHALPPYEIPHHLLRRTIKAMRQENGNVPESLWTDRGEAVETRVQEIIASQTDIVRSVTKNPLYTPNNDLTMTLIDGTVLKVEVKSSKLGIKAYKHKIREELITGETTGQLIGPWIRTRKEASDAWNNSSDEEKDKQTQRWLIDNNTILINGGEQDAVEKTPEEILTDSFYPQLQRILKAKREKAVKDFTQSPEKYRDKLAAKEETRQIFPSEDEQLTLPSF